MTFVLYRITCDMSKSNTFVLLLYKLRVVYKGNAKKPNLFTLFYISIIVQINHGKTDSRKSDWSGSPEGQRSK